MQLDKDALLAAIVKCSKERVIPFDLVYDKDLCDATDANCYKVKYNNSDPLVTSAHPYGSQQANCLETLQQLLHDHLEVSNILPQELLAKAQHVIGGPVQLDAFLQNKLVEKHSEFVIERSSFGHITGIKEQYFNRASESNSLNLSREYESTSGREFWRGTSEGIPFLPGGMEVAPTESLIDRDISHWLPEILGKNEHVSDSEELICKRLAQLALTQRPTSTESATIQTNLPVEGSSPEKGKIVKPSWAHVVDANAVPRDFSSVIPELAYKFPFELDAFQKQAVYHLEKGDCVFVAAHTSAGKTVVAEYAIALAFKHMTKAVYTSPIKALSNQKFRDFKNTFEDVGLLTGDVQIRPEANCLIMTTEILRSMLYKGADILRDVEFVVFDEVHYVNDIDRGHVWEEVIIMLPSHVNLILLSATVPNTVEFADWIGRTKRRDVYVITTLKRPVPLEHHLYLGEGCDQLIKIVDQNKEFLVQNYKNAFQLSKKDQKKRPEKPGGVKVEEAGSKQEKPALRADRRNAPSRNTWLHLVGMLAKKNLLPVVMFTFSKKRCDEYASAMESVELTNASERSAIHVFLKNSLARLNDDDSSLPQITRICDLLSRGIAVHHSGILPILKEAVEILFCRGLVKILFATETFAMGVNMPAKTVVFTGIRKHDGHSLRDLLPGEYTQMSGRAGRRGLDSTGMVIIYASDIPLDSNLKHMILGAPTKLVSQFKLTYNMILNLLRVEALKVEDMMKRSFSENDNQKSKGSVQKNLESSEKALKKAEKLDCPTCTKDIAEFYSLNVQLISMAATIHSYFIQQPKNKIFAYGAIIIVNNELYRNVPAVYLRFVNIDRCRKVECVPLLPPNAATTDIAYPYYEWTLPTGSNVPSTFEPTIVQIEIEHVLDVTAVFVPVRFTIMGIPSKGDLRNLVNTALDVLKKRGTMLAFGEADYAANCRDIDIITILTNRAQLVKQYNTFQCTRCPNLVSHYAKFHIQRSLAERVAEIQYQLTDNSLIMLPEYEQRIRVLKELNCIDEDENVLLKGRVACEFNTIDELIATELIFENMFKEYNPSEIIAFLSCMVFQEKSKSSRDFKTPPKVGADGPLKAEDFQYILDEKNETPLPGNLKKGKDMLSQIAIRLAMIQQNAGLSITVESYLEELKWGMLQVVYEWANGVSFAEITKITDIAEGSIVRCIVRLDETAREVKNAARIIGDTELLKKMEEASSSIKRDICFASSLYF